MALLCAPTVHSVLRRHQSVKDWFCRVGGRQRFHSLNAHPCTVWTTVVASVQR